MATLAEIAQAYAAPISKGLGGRFLRPRLVTYADEVGETAGRRMAAELESRALPVGMKLGLGLGAGTAAGAAGGTYVANRLTARKKLKAKQARRRTAGGV